MIIVHKIEDFLFDLFPKAKKAGNDLNVLKDELIQYYTYGAFKPKVLIEEGLVQIEIDTPTIISQDKDYQNVVSLCERGKYDQAKPILIDLIKRNPTNSEYHRIYGQILSDQGDQEEAINSLIDALKWDSKNAWALLLMGNIFAKYKNDISTAMKYYDQAHNINPKDNIALNNIGANLMQQGKVKEAKEYFEKALIINTNYPNTHYALAMIAEIEEDLNSAFFSATEAIKKNPNKDQLYVNSVNLAFDISRKIIGSGIGKKIFNEYLRKLEDEGKMGIDVISDNTLPTAAKFEFAENHNRNKHIIKYKPAYPAVEHLQMHELVHLEFVIEARKAKVNQLFVSTQVQKREFIKSLEPTIKLLKKRGVPEDSIAEYCSNLFDGMNRQIFNTPVDLFIEDFLYDEFVELRPYQFLSLYNLTQEAIIAVTNKKVLEISPREILSKSKIYNIVSTIHFKKLFGIDMINDFKASATELKEATALYDEFLTYKEDREPGEEYELVLHWAEDLKVNKNFELVDETEYRNKTTNLDNLIESIEKDPFELESNNPHKEREMEKFQQSQKAIGLNMAVVMFMVDALKYFKGMDRSKIKEIAFQIAMQGTQGFHPDKNGYRIPAIDNKEFSGYHILAYYYVSWKLVLPDMLKDLSLPYDKEYEMALTLDK